MEYKRLRGVGVSPGISYGEILLTEEVVFTERKENIPPSAIKSEINRLHKAIERTKEQLTFIREQVKEKIGEEHSFIFESHLMILEDKGLLSKLKDFIQKEKVKAEWALTRVHESYIKLFYNRS